MVPISIIRIAAASLVDEIMTVSDVIVGLKNLLVVGFELNEAVDLIRTLKDVAAFGCQEDLSFGDAIVFATEGITRSG